MDHFIHKSSFSSPVGIGKEVTIFFLLLFLSFLRIGSGLDLPFKDDLSSSLSPHHRDFGCWPGKVKIGPDMFGIHHIVRTAISLAGDNRNPWNGGFTES